MVMGVVDIGEVERTRDGVKFNPQQLTLSEYSSIGEFNLPTG